MAGRLISSNSAATINPTPKDPISHGRLLADGGRRVARLVVRSVVPPCEIRTCSPPTGGRAGGGHWVVAVGDGVTQGHRQWCSQQDERGGRVVWACRPGRPG